MIPKIRDAPIGAPLYKIEGLYRIGGNVCDFYGREQLCISLSDKILYPNRKLPGYIRICKDCANEISIRIEEGK